MPAKVVGGFVLLLLALLANAALAVYNVAALTRAGARAEQARQTLAELDGLLLALAEAESAQRGYLLTGEPADLRPFRLATRGADSVGDRLGRLRDSVRDADLPPLDEIERRCRRALRDLERTLDEYEAGDRAAVESAALGRSRRDLDAVREAAGGSRSAWRAAARSRPATCATC
jgi:CHASE3 domain sensor protein